MKIVKYSLPFSSIEYPKSSSLLETEISPVLKNFFPLASISPSQ